MKNYKGNMLLIELVIVILFFSLSQVVIVQVFAGAQGRNVSNSRMNHALAETQDYIEQLTGAKEPEDVLLSMGFGGSDGSYSLPMDGYEIRADVRRLSQPEGDLVTVQFTAMNGAEEMFTLPSVQYFPQEVPHE